MKNSAPPMINDHHGHEHEGEAAGAVALLARVDELLRARGRRRAASSAQIARQASADERAQSRRSMRQTFVRDSESGTAAASLRLLLRGLGLLLVLLPPVQHEQAEDEAGSTT